MKIGGISSMAFLFSVAYMEITFKRFQEPTNGWSSYTRAFHLELKQVLHYYIMEQGCRLAKLIVCQFIYSLAFFSVNKLFQCSNQTLIVVMFDVFFISCFLPKPCWYWSKLQFRNSNPIYWHCTSLVDIAGRGSKC